VRRNRWWLAIVGGVLTAMGLVSLFGARPGDTRLNVRVVVAEELPLEVLPGELTYEFDEPLIEVTQEVRITNRSTARETLRLTLVSGALTSTSDGFELTGDYRSLGGSPHLSCHLAGSTAPTIEPGQSLMLRIACRTATRDREGESLARLLITR
jgi:hypothetical protein